DGGRVPQKRPDPAAGRNAPVTRSRPGSRAGDLCLVTGKPHQGSRTTGQPWKAPCKQPLYLSIVPCQGAPGALVFARNAFSRRSVGTGPLARFSVAELARVPVGGKSGDIVRQNQHISDFQKTRRLIGIQTMDSRDRRRTLAEDSCRGNS